MSFDKPAYESGPLRIAPFSLENLPVFRELMGEMVQSMDMADIYTVSDEELRTALLSDPPQMEAIIAWYEGEAAGLATWTHGFHLVRGKQVMSFEYIFVRPRYRRQLVPLGLLLYLLVLARRRGYLRIEGFVEDWNEDVAELYSKLKAESVDQKSWRLDLDKVDWEAYGRMLGMDLT